MERCIVCGMDVKISKPVESTIYKNKTYYFCTTLCMVLFLQVPEKYIDLTKTKNIKTK
ncbi:YHS domain protein [bacterium BMS3Abin04]|nr:YHS domain protein [bacterium BMS3Abin04]